MEKRQESTPQIGVPESVGKRRRLSNPLVRLALDLSPIVPGPNIVKAEPPAIPLNNPTEAPTRLDQIRNEMKSLWDQERLILETRDETAKQTIKSLELRLADALESQAAAETLFSLEKLQFQKQIKELIGENNKLRRSKLEEAKIKKEKFESEQMIKSLKQRLTDAHDTHLAAEQFLSSENATLKERMKEVVEENDKLQQVILSQSNQYEDDSLNPEKMTSTLKENCNLNSSSNRENTDPNKGTGVRATELIAAKIKIDQLEYEKMDLWIENQDLLPRAARAVELEQELKLADNIISNLRRTLTEKAVQEKDAPEDAPEDAPGRSEVQHLEDSVDNVVEILDTSNASEEEPHGKQESVNLDEGPCSGLESFENSTNEPQVTTESPQDMGIKPIWVGKFYIFATDPKFFDIEWARHYRRVPKAGYKCNDCKHMSAVRVRMEDHIWSRHYGGRYQCPQCPYLMPRRYDIKGHMEVIHRATVLDGDGAEV